MKSLKETAKKLFAKVHGYTGFVTVYIIKKKYPKFLSSKREHWELLILKLLGRNAKANNPTLPPASKAIEPYDELKELINTYSSVGYIFSRVDFFMGISVRVIYVSISLGSIGYCTAQKRWYAQFGRNGRNQYVDTLQQAWDRLLKMNQYNVA